MQENNYTIRSKKYIVPAKKNNIFIILLNVCLAIGLIAGIITLIFDGFNISVLGGMCLAFIIVQAYKSKPNSKARYEFVIVDTCLSASIIKLIYRNVPINGGKEIANEVVLISPDKINTLEYSDQMCCLRFTGQIRKYYDIAEDKIVDTNEHLLYLEKGFEDEVILLLEQISKKNVVYVDR